jgi:alcohol dehydrogenase (NADP+)
MKTFDFIIFTVSAECDFTAYVNLLKNNGKIIVVGAPPKPVGFGVFNIIASRRTVAGSMIGGIKQTQDMLDFCGRHNIVCDIEMVTASQINECYERAIAGDVKYRFVIDAATF